MVGAALGTVVVVVGAWFFYSTANRRGSRSVDLARRFGLPGVDEGTHAAIVRAMALTIAAVAVAAFVVLALMRHS